VCRGSGQLQLFCLVLRHALVLKRAVACTIKCLGVLLCAVRMQSVTESEARIRRTATHTEEAEAELEMAETLGTKGLVDAVDSLPALLKQKKTLEMHANVMHVRAARPTLSKTFPDLFCCYRC
jgi:hypothetical protein